MAETKINLKEGERAQRKLLITVAEWTGDKTPPTGDSGSDKREILGTRTEDSSIELNPDIATSTDILGITYSDVNKTEPSQTFDPFYLIGGSKLGEYLTKAMLSNDITAYNNTFNVYIITAYISQDTSAYYAVRHKGCSIIPTAIGGDAYVNMPIEVHYSNNIEEGTVDKLSSDFIFTSASEAV